MAPGKGECCLWVQMPGRRGWKGHCAAQKSLDMLLGLPPQSLLSVAGQCSQRTLEVLGGLMAPHPLPLGLDLASGAVCGGQVERVCLRVEGLWMFPWKQMQPLPALRRCWRCLQPVVWCPAENSGTGCSPLSSSSSWGVCFAYGAWFGLEAHPAWGTPTIMGECRHLP